MHLPKTYMYFPMLWLSDQSAQCQFFLLVGVGGGQFFFLGGEGLAEAVHSELRRTHKMLILLPHVCKRCDLAPLERMPGMQ